MTQNTKLLSICIPTYNRAEILGRTLEGLLSDPDFDPARVDIVVSDNASTDNTAEVVARWPQVRYHRNETCIGANANFTLALELAGGRYLHLLNDTAFFRPGMLGKMLRTIETADPAAENLIFQQLGSLQELVVRGKNQLLGALSYYITWIGNFGAWRADFEKIVGKKRFVDGLLCQVDWILQLAENGKPTRIVRDDFFVVEDVKIKGGYNFFQVFITNYFAILKLHRIGRCSFAREKFRLFLHFILPCILRNHQYDVDMGDRAVMTRRYWYEPYYFPLLLLYKPLVTIKKTL